MEIPKVSLLPKYTNADLSKKGFLNTEDIEKIVKNMLIFLTPTLVLYGSQLMVTLGSHTLSLSDLVPSQTVIGAFQGYIISTALDYLKKLNDGGN